MHAHRSRAGRPRSQRLRVVLVDHRLAQIDTDYEPKALIRMIIDDYFLGTDGHGFLKKGTAGLRDG